jgi:hypothetical protein
LYDVSTSRKFEKIENCVTIIDPEDSSTKEDFHDRISQSLERIKDDSSGAWRVCFLGKLSFFIESELFIYNVIHEDFTAKCDN